MATETKNPVEKAKEIASSKQVKELDQKTKPFQEFLTKFNNDGTMTFAGTLAYNLMLAMFPILIALLAILGITLGRLSPDTVQNIKQSITNVFPGQASGQIVNGALTQLSRSSGILLIFAVLVAVFGGSRLFIVIEQFLDLIYHIRPRTFIPQNFMAIGMLLAFIIVIPVMFAASSAPAIILGLSNHVPFLAQNRFMSRLISFISGILGGIIASFILFEVIFVVVPNQKISWTNSWRGSLVAAILLEVYLFAFPFYASNFLKGYAGVIGGGIILLLFFYYFAVILLLGGEINAFFSEHVQPLPNDIITFVTTMAGHVNKDRPGTEANHISAKPTDRAIDERFGQSSASRTSNYQGNNNTTRAKNNTQDKANTKDGAYPSRKKNKAPEASSQEPNSKQQAAHARARLKEQDESQKEMTAMVPQSSTALLSIAIAAVVTLAIELFHLLRGQGR